MSIVVRVVFITLVMGLVTHNQVQDIDSHRQKQANIILQCTDRYEPPDGVLMSKYRLKQSPHPRSLLPRVETQTAAPVVAHAEMQTTASRDEGPDSTGVQPRRRHCSCLHLQWALRT